MAVENFPDGIMVGPDNGRLPLIDFDEWIVTDGLERIIGTLAAGEQKVMVFNGIETVRAGARILAQPLNLGRTSVDGMDCLIIKAAWVSDEQQISVLVKNDSNAEVVYGVDEWSFMYFNTSN